MISTFKCIIKAAITKERDELLSTASIEEIKKFIPNIDTETNIDLLPISFDSCVVNKFNKNGDGIDSAAAVAIAKDFKFKPINVEHNRTNIAGVILNASFSSISGHKPMTEEECLATEQPFYITLGGVLWRYVKPELADYVEECSDPSSEDYENVSASWELSFEDYKIALRSDASRLIKGSEIIEDKAEIDKIENAIKNKFSGAKYNGKKVYRIISGGLTPLGIGLTENPAADVSGIATNTEKTEQIEEVKANEDVKASEEKNSKIDNLNVIEEKRVNNMTLNSLDQITDDFIKTATASTLRNFFEAEIQKANEKYTALEKEKNDASLEREKLTNSLKETQEKFEAVNKELQALKELTQAAENQRLFDIRMEKFETEFSLSTDIRKILASELPAISSEEAFISYYNKMKALLPIKKQEVQASEVVPVNPEAVINNVVKTAEIEQPVIPNTQSPQDSFLTKYARAFAPENFTIEIGRRQKK